MQYTKGKKTNGKISVEFVLDAQEWESYVEKAYQQEKGKYKKEGFRQGKVPRKVLEGTYGEGVFYEAAFDICFPKIYSEMLVKEKDIVAVDYPGIEIKSVGKEGLKFVAVVELLPEVTLGAYTGLEVKQEKAKVAKGEVDAELDRLRDRNARFEDVVGRAAKMGDVVEINYSGSTEGKKFDGGTASGQELALGSNTFIPGFEEGVVGMNIGDKKAIDVVFPKQYHEPSLAGKPAVFEVELLSIREKKLPDLNDEFAKDVSEKDTLEELKKEISDRILSTKEKNSEIKVENDLVKMIVDASKVEVPDSMIEHQLDYFVDDFAYRLSYQGLKFEDYLKYIGKTEKEYREMRRDEAKTAVKTNLVLDEIIQKEKIEATDEEIEEYFAKLQPENTKSKKSTKSAMTGEQKKSIKNRIISEKLVDFLKSKNKIVKV